MNEANLWGVSAGAASSVVIMPDLGEPKEIRDAFVLRCLVGLRGKGWPLKGRILAMCSLPRNKLLLQKTGGSNTDIVLLERSLASLMVQCSEHHGIGDFVQQTLGFHGAGFCLASVSDAWVGVTFAEVVRCYPAAVVCGVLSADGACALCPGEHYRLQPGDELVLLAASGSSGEDAEEAPWARGIAAAEKWADDASPCSLEPGSDLEKEPETVLVMGWNDRAALVMLELDDVLPKGSSIVMLSPKPIGKRQEELDMTIKRTHRDMDNCAKITHVVGDLSSRSTLELLSPPLSQFSRFFVLADECCPTPLKADTCSIAAVMHVLEILKENSQQPPERRRPLSSVSIVPEFYHHETKETWQKIRLSDYIDSCALPCQILATMVLRPRIAPVLGDILSPEGRVSFATASLRDYIGPDEEGPSSVSFLQVQELAGPSGDVVVGWSRSGLDGHHVTPGYLRDMEREADIVEGAIVSWEISPEDKLRTRPWCAQKDVLVVLRVTGSTALTPRSLLA